MAKKKRAPRKRAARSAKKSSRTKRVARKPAASGLSALARQIVRLTEAPSFDEERALALYAADCVSEESTGTVARGHAGIREKNAGWNEMQTASRWKANQVWLGPKSICIEWEGVVSLRDGRTVTLQEVAVHEIRNGRIQNERYYYNPMVLAPPAR